MSKMGVVIVVVALAVGIWAGEKYVRPFVLKQLKKIKV